MLQPKVGDTVVCEFEVSEVKHGHFRYTIGSNSAPSYPIPCEYITEIKPQPFKVGDTVWWVGNECPYESYQRSALRGGTLIHIHDIDGRKFAVVAYGGDMPRSIWFRDLRRSYSECVV